MRGGNTADEAPKLEDQECDEEDYLQREVLVAFSPRELKRSCGEEEGRTVLRRRLAMSSQHPERLAYPTNVIQ